MKLIGLVESNKQLLIVTPYYEFGSLKDYLQECGQILDHLTLTKFSLEVARGVEYLASLKLVHRDLAVSDLGIFFEGLKCLIFVSCSVSFLSDAPLLCTL